MSVVGVDGMKRGWVAVVLDSGRVDAFGASKIAGVLDRASGAEAIAIDMPIGFLEAAVPGGRDCEKLARAMLGSRASSVFSSPCRSALSAPDYESANAINRASSPDHLGLSKQAHAIFPKMIEIDEAMSASLQDRVFEVHPEVCFTELARLSRRSIDHGKKTFLGASQRIELLKAAGIDITPLLERQKDLGAAADDIVDAAVAAWTARRYVEGAARRLPETPPVDARGLRMEMWF